MPITIQNSAGGGVTLDSTTSSNETLQLPSGGGTLAPLASPVFTGNVGIGVVPKAWNGSWTALQLGATGFVGSYQAGGTDLTVLGSNVWSDGTYKYIETDEAAIYKQQNGAHVWEIAPSGTADAAISFTTAMVIDNNGQIKAGNLQDSLQTSRGISCSGNGYASLRVRRGADNGACMAFYGSSSTSSGVGSISVTTSSTAYNTSSDYRLKTDVQPMTGATDRVKLLKPCNFEWISDGTRVDGFLAHEAQEVVPEAVTGTKDAMMDEEYEVAAATDTEAAVMGTRSVPDMQGIDQSKLVPLLTATIQELIARIEALENV